MKKNIFLTLSAFITLAMPTVTCAFSLKDSTFNVIIYEIISVISVVIPILFALSFLVFFWGLSKFILNSGSATEVQKGKTYIIWGVLALFILISFRTIIGIIATDLDIGSSSFIPVIPTTTNPSGADNSTFNLQQGVPAQ